MPNDKKKSDEAKKPEEAKKQPEVKKTSEQAYFDKVSGGHNVNQLENPYATAMSYAQATKIIEEKYKDFKGTEVPLDLQQARMIVKNPT